MNLLARFFHRSRHAAGPRLLTGRHAKRTAARLAETVGALPTVVERDRAETLAHIRSHWRIEDAETGIIPIAEDHELVRGHVRELHRMQGWH
jgi:hypothetical protein